MTDGSNRKMVQTLLLPRFGPGFLQDHAGLIISDPRIAIVEIVANAWDAGADRVDVKWPEECPGLLVVADNGTGMSGAEFCRRWMELSYDRMAEQGDEVEFPKGNRHSSRKAFGRSGKGRHSAFCFADEYAVETWKGGEANRFKVDRVSGESPFRTISIGRNPKDGHGTSVSAEMVRNYLPVQTIHELIGATFVADPSFRLYVNGKQVELTDLDHRCEVQKVPVNGYGTVIVRRFDSQTRGRTSRPHGVAWWVKRRMVGEQSRRDQEIELAYLDGRSTHARRFTFVAEVDILADQVKPDWTGFYASEKTNAVRHAVQEHILRQLQELNQDERNSRKVAALHHTRQILRDLSPLSRDHVARFAEGVQMRCPSLGTEHLSNVVEVLARLEQSRSGYALLGQLAKLPPNDLHELNLILDRWSVYEIRLVLNELHWRLKLIERLQALVNSPSADELHDIQPLFEAGLWIFGPEYESVHFVANRTLAIVVREFFQRQGGTLENSKRRPDFVALPDTSIGLYAGDAHDERGEVVGTSKVLIVELKKGGFEINRKEKQQTVAGGIVRW